MTATQRITYIRQRVDFDYEDMEYVAYSNRKAGCASEAVMPVDTAVHLTRHVGCPCFVAEVNDRFAGYVIYSFHRRRLHIEHLAVDKQFWRQQVGSQLFAAVSRRIGNQFQTVTTSVHESLLPMHCLLRAMGARAISTLNNHYQFVYQK
jgi:ribosomal protein S18 acetylase RimI-like enzyme